MAEYVERGDDAGTIADCDLADLIGEALLQVWREGSSRASQHPQRALLVRFAAGQCADAQARGLLSHLAVCAHCRATARTVAVAFERLADTCWLPYLAELADEEPDLTAEAVARVSRRLGRHQLLSTLSTLPAPPLRLPVWARQGVPTGEVATLACLDGPRLDGRHAFHLVLVTDNPAFDGAGLQLAFLDAAGPIAIGQASLLAGYCEISADWSFLDLAPGPFAADALAGAVCLDVTASQPVPDSLQTAPFAPLLTTAARTESTPEQMKQRAAVPRKSPL